MRRIITANGNYYVLHAPEGALTDSAIPVLRSLARTGADLLYGDELEIGADGSQRLVSKPEPSPDTLLSYNYIGSPLAVSEALMHRAGPPASESYAERWAFALRALFSAVFPLHISRVLFAGKPQRREPDAALIDGMLKRLHRQGRAYPVHATGCVRVRYACPPDTLLSAVVAADGTSDMLFDTLNSLRIRNAEVRTEYIVVDGGAPNEGKELDYRALKACGVKIVGLWHENNLARQFNCAMTRAEGEALLFLHAGDTVESADALQYMLEFAMQPHVGAVGAQNTGALPEPICTRNVGSIRGALMLSRDMLLSAGGFDESLAQSGCETALSITLRERRRQLICTPDAQIRTHRRVPELGDKNKMRLKDYSL